MANPNVWRLSKGNTGWDVTITVSEWPVSLSTGTVAVKIRKQGGTATTAASVSVIGSDTVTFVISGNDFPDVGLYDIFIEHTVSAVVYKAKCEGGIEIEAAP